MSITDACSLLTSLLMTFLTYYILVRYGRQLLAARDLSPGYLVLSESPLIWGPDTSYEALLCTACNRSDVVQKLVHIYSLNSIFRGNGIIN